MKSLFVCFAVMLLANSNLSSQAGASERVGSDSAVTLISEATFKKIAMSCSAVTESDRRAINKTYEELHKHAENGHVSKECNLQLDQLEEARIRLDKVTDRVVVHNTCVAQEQISCGDEAGTQVLQNDFDGAVSSIEARIGSVLRACPTGNGRLDKILMALDVGMSTAALFVPAIGPTVRLAQTGKDIFAAGRQLKKDQNYKRKKSYVSVSWLVARKLMAGVPGFGLANGTFKGTRTFLNFKSRNNKRQFMEKIIACRTNENEGLTGRVAPAISESSFGETSN
jgi:hypothetical protein